MWPLILAGAGLGMVKSAEEKKQRAQMGKAAAAQTKYSPWTGMGAGQVPAPQSSLMPILQGAMTGAMLGQSLGAPTAPGAGAPVATTSTTQMPAQFNPYMTT
ncbi:MAG: hypothetical protein GY861_09605 [bacterium]|nr:hypothetical protein [bacterium]